MVRERPCPGHGQFLHAKTLGFEQPTGQAEWLEFSVQPPEALPSRRWPSLRKKRVEAGMKRYLILEDGSSYAGDGIGAMITATGELAIQTSNYGYQEVLTDPSNAGKIIVFTTPMIGSNGINAVDYESIQPSVRGVIANDIALNITDNDTFQSLGDFLQEKKVPAIFNVDTRALVRKLQNLGPLKASIMDTNDEHAFDQIRALVLPKNKTTLGLHQKRLCCS
jgi:carbamoylphosphate synthase small subunit